MSKPAHMSDKQYKEMLATDEKAFNLRKKHGLSLRNIALEVGRSYSYVRAALRRHAMRVGEFIPPSTERKPPTPRIKPKFVIEIEKRSIEEVYGTARYTDEAPEKIASGEASLASEVNLFNDRLLRRPMVECLSGVQNSTLGGQMTTRNGVSLAW